MTPIMFAAMFGPTRVVEQLQAHGTSLQCRNRLSLSANLMVRASRFTAWCSAEAHVENSAHTRLKSLVVVGMVTRDLPEARSAVPSKPGGLERE